MRVLILSNINISGSEMGTSEDLLDEAIIVYRRPTYVHTDVHTTVET